MALRALKARLGCARLLLLDVDAASRRSISQLQAAAVQDLFHRAASELDLDAKASLMEDVQQCQFEASDSAVLMSTIAGSVEISSSSRRLPQDFCEIFDFLTAMEWSVVLNTKINQNSRMSILLSRALALGCRCPSEPTFKLWAAIILASGGAEEALCLSYNEKMALMKTVKSEFRRFKRRLPAPVVYLTKLPVLPSELPPSIFDAAYPDEQAVACPRNGS
jgi:hypothetical protein